MNSSASALKNAGEGTALQAASPAPSGAGRLEYIDGLRAVACILVIICHLSVNFPTVLGSSHVSWTFSMDPLRPLGVSGVNLFLVISGFCLYWPFTKSHAKEPSLKTYLWRRCRRILPPYYIACLLTAGLAFVAHDASGSYLLRWLVVHFAILHTSIPGYCYKLGYAGPFWSIALEFQCYLLFPVLVELYRRIPPRWVLCGLFFLNALWRGYVMRQVPGLTYDSDVETSFLLYNSLYGRCFEFALGMFCARLISEWNRTGKSPLQPLDVVLMAYSVVPLTLFGKTFGNATQGLGWLFAGPLSYPFMDPWYGLAYGGLLLLAGRTRFFVHRVLSHPILVRIGVISYSIYLLHTQVIYVAKRLLIRFIDSPNSYVRFAAAYGVIFPLILAVGYGFHMLVERRFLSGHARRETAAELHQPASPAALDATVPS